MEYPRILVAIPVSDKHGFATSRLIEALEKINYPVCDILVVDNSDTDEHFNQIVDILNRKININIPSRIKVIRDFYGIKKIRAKLVAFRNYARQLILDGDYEYLFCIDQDTIPPPNVLEVLIDCGEDIVTGIYYNYQRLASGGVIKLPIIWGFFSKEDIKEAKDNIETIRRLNPKICDLLLKFDDDYLINYLKKPISTEEAMSGKKLDIKVCGTGCILIRRNVLKNISFRYDETTNAFDDTFFCQDALVKGYKIYAETKVQCEHLIAERPWDWSQFIERKEI